MASRRRVLVLLGLLLANSGDATTALCQTGAGLGLDARYCTVFPRGESYREYLNLEEVPTPSIGQLGEPRTVEPENALSLWLQLDPEQCRRFTDRNPEDKFFPADGYRWYEMSEFIHESELIPIDRWTTRYIYVNNNVGDVGEAESLDRMPSDNSRVTPPVALCADAGRANLLNITEHEGSVVSICRLDAQGDCLYTKEFGKTFVSDRPDLNGDGHVDFLIKDFSGAYGNHEVVHHLGYAACAQGGYIKVLDTFATRASVTEGGRKDEWATIEIIRDCFDDDTQSIVSRRYTLFWDSGAGRYGPPDGDSDLLDYCTAKEMALPAQR